MPVFHWWISDVEVVMTGCHPLVSLSLFWSPPSRCAAVHPHSFLEGALHTLPPWVLAPLGMCQWLSPRIPCCSPCCLCPGRAGRVGHQVPPRPCWLFSFSLGLVLRGPGFSSWPRLVPAGCPQPSRVGAPSLLHRRGVLGAPVSSVLASTVKASQLWLWLGGPAVNTLQNCPASALG